MLRCLRELQDFEYLNCTRDNHESQPLSIVCADGQCDCRSLLCIFCEQQYHSNHKTQPLKVYLQKVMTATYQQVIENSHNIPNKKISDDEQEIKEGEKNIFTYSTVADEFKEKFHLSIEEFRAGINDMIDQMKNYGGLYIKQLDYKIKEIFLLMKQVESLIRQNKQFQQTAPDTDGYQMIASAYQKRHDKRIKALLKYGFFDEDNQILINEQLQTIITDCQYRQNEVMKVMKKYMSSLKNVEIKAICELLVPEIQTYKPNVVLQWSEKLKGTSMKITDAYVQRIPGSSNQRFALIEKSLFPFVKKKKAFRWTLRIRKLIGWIGVGVCLKNAIVNSNYNFNYQNLGHGSYMLSSNGYSWSSSQQSKNSVHHSISFTTGDYITLQFDPNVWKLNFYIRSKEFNPKSLKKKCKVPISKEATKFLALDIEDSINALDSYYPCVNLCSSGDSVEIV